MNTLKDRKPSPCGGVPRLWGSYEHMEVSGVGLSIWSRSTVSSCGPRARLATRGLVTLRVWFTLLLPAWPTWQASLFGFCWPPAQPFFSFSRREGNPGDSLCQPRSKAGQSSLSHQPYQADVHAASLAYLLWASVSLSVI